ncbi:MAG: DNA repair protein RecO [Gemmatimonadetes bacterium]|nr:DNA repair protein RecO [Gemmatimonadota bacterium]
MALVSTVAVVLRSHDYGDTSRILRFYTRGHGLVSAMAKGVRGRSGRGTTAIGTFATGVVSLYLKNHRDLQTMKDFSCTRLREGLAKDVLRFAGASALAELVLAHVAQEAHPELFDAIESGLDTLESVDTIQGPAAALSGVWQITRVLGFEPQLEICVRCGIVFTEDEVGRFDFPAGGLACFECSQYVAGPVIGPLARFQVAQLVQGQIDEEINHPKKHLAVLSEFLSYHVLSKPMKSLGFMEALLPEDVNPK